MTPAYAPAYDGSTVDGPAYVEVTGLAHGAPGWLDTLVSAWSAYGLAFFALLMAAAWWRARRAGTPTVVTALAVPLITVLAFGVDSLLKLVVREDRPCRSLHLPTLEACPAPGDWSFPSNHAALAAAAAVALLFVSRRLGAVALAAAVLMAASRVWVGAHYPHDALAGCLVGAAVAAAAARAVRRRQGALADRLKRGPLRPLLATA
ncbi:phosphatase PAP2 family protein [Streptomyces sp. NBC_00536]|uniref:phosphatase PAP2 family protein n=1 Tax=Streptomyces sp. NBC_00536 TaxID=2975769 RepID=UPI002E80651C|nr:phosphatase PAP2 family protein [Streptomyces sp. NBC_00536]WUC77135.1 phosphatase PAP2 family protein [Streptomyces sp. NBC_00536]